MDWFINQYGIKTGSISIPGICPAGTYITANGWVDEEHIIVSAHKSVDTMECSLLLVDIKSVQAECVADRTMGFSVILNDNDGSDRFWVEYTSGIGSIKDTSLFGKLTLKK